MENSYTSEELLKLVPIIMVRRLEQAYFIDQIIGSLLKDIIEGASNKPELVYEMVHQNLSHEICKAIYHTSIEEMPPLMGHPHSDMSAIAYWRLLIGK